MRDDERLRVGPAIAEFLDQFKRGLSGVRNLSGEFDHRNKIFKAAGGFSFVYATYWAPQDAPPVQICYKELHPPPGSDIDLVGKTIRRLVREVRIWKNLDHPNITQFIGYAIEGEGCDRRAVLVSRWCANGDIVEYLKKRPESDRIQLIGDVAHGLQYLHNQASTVVHGDLKPHNVLVSDQGTAQLCDFGLSRVWSELSKGSQTTASTTPGFTTRYSAYEVIAEEVKTVKSDVYAFGCTCIYILFNQHPFPKLNNEFQVYTAIGNHQAPWPWDKSILLERVLSACCQSGQGSRPSMDNVLWELRLLPSLIPKCPTRAAIPAAQVVNDRASVPLHREESSDITPIPSCDHGEPRSIGINEEMENVPTTISGPLTQMRLSARDDLLLLPPERQGGTPPPRLGNPFSTCPSWESSSLSETAKRNIAPVSPHTEDLFIIAPVDMEYYDLLGVKTDAGNAELKEVYRKMAIRYHTYAFPDAEEKFKDVSKAYQVLSDPNLRASYDKNGKKMAEDVNPADPQSLFADVFGGDAFEDFIGKISLRSNMTARADILMTDENRAEMKAVAGSPGASPPNTTPAPSASQGPSAKKESRRSGPLDLALRAEKTGTIHRPVADTPGASKLMSPDETRGSDRRGRTKPAPEQMEMLKKIDKESRKVMEERIETLTQKLKDRVRPFIELKDPGDSNDPERQSFEEKMRKEADDLKYESFGVELLHTIGIVYLMKATSQLKSKKFLGIPGFFSRLKEEGAIAKDIRRLAKGVHAVMGDMNRIQNGELPDEELRALEADLTGKTLLVSWRRTRLEVSQVLREVIDRTLKDKDVGEDVILKRAKAIFLLGAIYRSIEVDEAAEERRELERLAAEAAIGLKSKKY